MMLGSMAGAVVGGFGSVNIALRKGTRDILEVELKKEIVVRSAELRPPEK
jgi:hypothetical protein